MGKISIAVGMVTGLMVAGAVGVMVSNGTIKPRKVARCTAHAMNAMGDAVDAVSDFGKHGFCH